MFHILCRDFQVHKQHRRRSIVRTVGIVFRNSSMSSADTSAIRKGLSCQRRVHVRVENGGQRHDTLAVQELARMQRRILDRFTRAECVCRRQQESK
jgi:hypothetical protein